MTDYTPSPLERDLNNLRRFLEDYEISRQSLIDIEVDPNHLELLAENTLDKIRPLLAELLDPEPETKDPLDQASALLDYLIRGAQAYTEAQRKDKHA